MRTLNLLILLSVLFSCSRHDSAGYDEKGEKLTGMQMKEREEAEARRQDLKAAEEEAHEDGPGPEAPADYLKD